MARPHAGLEHEFASTDPTAGKMIAEVFGSSGNMRLLGLEGAEGGMVVAPPPPGSTDLNVGDRLMVYGEQAARGGALVPLLTMGRHRPSA